MYNNSKITCSILINQHFQKHHTEIKKKKENLKKSLCCHIELFKQHKNIRIV